VSTTGPFDGNQTCDQLKGNIHTTESIFFVSLGQSLDGFHASVSTVPLGDMSGSSVYSFNDGSTGIYGQGIVTITRDPVIKAFNVLLFIGE
jgi:hypothetical protein